MQPQKVEANSSLREEKKKLRRSWQWLLLLLTLLMSFGCVFCSTQLALSLWPERLAPADMLAGRQADYSGGPDDGQFAVLDPLVGAQAATDIARLHVTPTGVEDDIALTIGLLPATPTPTPKLGPSPMLVEVTKPAANGTLAPATATPVAPVNSTATGTPIGPPPTLINTATPIFQPTLTPIGTATLAPPTATLPPLLPTSTPVPTSPPNNPTATPVSNPTATNTQVPIPTATNTSVSIPTPTNTSTSTPTPTFTPASVSITGQVFEDVNYSGGSGTAFGAGDVALANVRVEIYNGSGIFINFATTDASGNYSFTIPSGSSYTLRVVSTSIGDGDTSPAAGFNGGFSSALAEQTYESNGVTGNGGAGGLGGNNASADDASTPPGAGIGDTNVTVTVSASNVAGVSFGFAYNLIVNSQDGGQGSLRQFLLNANAIAGPAAGQFNIPTTDPNYNTSIANAFVVRPASALPSLTDNATLLEGTTQETNQGDLRAGLPDIVVDGVNAGANAIGLTIYSNINTMRKLDIRNFNQGNGTGVIVDGGDNNTLTDNYITANTNNSGATGAIQFYNATDANTITGNTIIGNFSDGLNIPGGADNLVTNNISTNNGQDGFVLGGTRMTFNNNTAQNNGPAVTNACGVELNAGLTNSVIAGNVSSGNGFQGGICLIGTPSSNNTIGPNNTVSSNAGAGISSPLAASVNNLFTQNVIFANGGLGIDLETSGVTLNDSGDGDAGSNGLMNFPVIYTATISSGNVTITGEARPGAVVEFFASDPDSSGYGEGSAFIGSNTVGGAIPGAVDPSALQFTFIFPAGSLAVGNQITATASDSAGNTSEFSLNISVN